MIETGKINIAGALHSIDTTGIVAYTGDIYDPLLKKSQKEINTILLSELEQESGYNKVVLTPNMIGNTNVLTQDMVNQEHCIYTIINDYNLQNETINIPKDCILDFQGGSFCSGKLVLDETKILSFQKIFEHNIELSGSIKGNLSPIMFGLNSTNDKDSNVYNYKSIFYTYKNANKLECNVKWEDVNKVEMEIPNGFPYITLTQNNDFCNTSFIVTNKSHKECIFKLEKSNDFVQIDIDKTTLGGSDYSQYTYFDNGTYLLSIYDQNIWTHRTDSADDSDFYRKDLIVIKDNTALNLPCFTYNTESSLPYCKYRKISENRFTFKNINITCKDCQYVTNILVISGILDIDIDNVKIEIADNNQDLSHGVLFSFLDCANLNISNTSVYGTYDNYGFAYGFHLQNCTNINIDNLTTINKNWGVFGTQCLNNVKVSNSNINRFDIHCYGKDITINNCSFKHKYNSISGIFGNVVYNNCQFEYQVPLVYDNSYHVFSPFNLILNNCTFVLNNKDFCVFSMSSSDVTIYDRDEIKEFCLPNICINNLYIKKYDYYDKEGRVVLYKTGYNKDIVAKYISNVKIDGVTTDGHDYKIFISNDKINCDKPVCSDLNRICLFQKHDGSIIEEPQKFQRINGLVIDGFKSDKPCTVNVSNSSFGLQLQHNYDCQINALNCTITGIRYYDNSTSNINNFINCKFYLTDIDDEFYTILSNGIYTNCYFERAVEKKYLKLYSRGKYEFHNCSKNNKSHLLENGLDLLNELFGIKCIKQSVNDSYTPYEYIYNTNGKTSQRPVLNSSFICSYYDTDIQSYVNWNGYEWIIQKTNMHVEGETLIINQ